MKSRWLWCIGLGLVTGVGALLWFGVRPWTIGFALLMLVCPAVIVWGAMHVWRSSRPTRVEDAPWSPSTRGKGTGGG